MTKIILHRRGFIAAAASFLAAPAIVKAENLMRVNPFSRYVEPMDLVQYAWVALNYGALSNPRGNLIKVMVDRSTTLSVGDAARFNRNGYADKATCAADFIGFVVG